MNSMNESTTSVTDTSAINIDDSVDNINSGQAKAAIDIKDIGDKDDSISKKSGVSVSKSNASHKGSFSKKKSCNTSNNSSSNSSSNSAENIKEAQGGGDDSSIEDTQVCF